MRSYIAITAVGAIIGAAVTGMPVMDNQASASILNAQIPAQAGVTGFKHNIRQDGGLGSSQPIVSFGSKSPVIHQATSTSCTKTATDGHEQPIVTTMSKCTTFSVNEASLGLTGIMEICAGIKSTVSMDIGTKTTLEQVNAPIVTAPHITSALSMEIVTSAPVEPTTTQGMNERISSWCATATRSDGSKPHLCTVSVDYEHPDPTRTFIYTPFSGPTPTEPTFFLTTLSEDPVMPLSAPVYTPFANATSSELSFFLTTLSKDPEKVAPSATSSTEDVEIGLPVITRVWPAEPVETETQTVVVTVGV
ncbi:hypothetical protein CSAL01_00987 [Colletotrichum salicis]|uniref:Uncharacterized protein n=1 Tax=Colletotrichum salicis TaxID=1209931 RepID=A0A135UNK9_9PEZI|nr:hypothetical protein CSAL01_00987 [Colletotrichum salicis]